MFFLLIWLLALLNTLVISAVLAWEDVKLPTPSPPPHELCKGGRFGQGQPVRPEHWDFLDPAENCCPLARLWKSRCPYILEGHLSTNLKLSALHFQGPNSNIYLHFHWINKQLTEISFPEWIVNTTCN